VEIQDEILLEHEKTRHPHFLARQARRSVVACSKRHQYLFSSPAQRAPTLCALLSPIQAQAQTRSPTGAATPRHPQLRPYTTICTPYGSPGTCTCTWHRTPRAHPRPALIHARAHPRPFSAPNSLHTRPREHIITARSSLQYPSDATHSKASGATLVRRSP
jgi:hypothetical protein